MAPRHQAQSTRHQARPFRHLPCSARGRMDIRTTSTVAASACLAGGCGGRTVAVSPRAPVPPPMLAELRVAPGRVPRDLFWGVGGRRYAPPASAAYKLEAKDETGFSVSFDVTSPDGVEWSA